MTEQKENALINAESIVRDVIRHDDVENMRDYLKEMLISWIYQYDCPSDEWKGQIIGTYEVLDNALKNMKSVEKQVKNQTA